MNAVIIHIAPRPTRVISRQEALAQIEKAIKLQKKGKVSF